MPKKKLTARWSKRERDYLYSYPDSPDGHLLYGFFAGYTQGPEFLKELEARGYDMTTLRFSIELKPKPLTEKA
jgi:hypothetical protein